MKIPMFFLLLTASLFAQAETQKLDISQSRLKKGPLEVFVTSLTCRELVSPAGRIDLIVRDGVILTALPVLSTPKASEMKSSVLYSFWRTNDKNLVIKFGKNEMLSLQLKVGIDDEIKGRLYSSDMNNVALICSNLSYAIVR